MTAINTVSGLMEIRGSGAPWPHIGHNQLTTYGGVSGNAIRPFGLRAVSAVAAACPRLVVLGSGGVDSADTAYQYFSCGASAVQVSVVTIWSYQNMILPYHQ